jgi:hypothetical protein
MQRPALRRDCEKPTPIIADENLLAKIRMARYLGRVARVEGASPRAALGPMRREKGFFASRSAQAVEKARFREAN